MQRRRNPWVTAAIFFVALSVPAAALFFSFRATYDEMMFRPSARSREQMSLALKNRFGSKVELLKVTFVDRDITGFVGIVQADSLPMTIYRSDEFVFAFEKRVGRQLCFMTTSEGRLSLLRDQFKRRGP